MVPGPCEKSHHEQTEVTGVVLGHGLHPLVCPALMQPSMLGKTDLLELEKVEQRSCTGSQHLWLSVIHVSALCLTLTGCQAVL